MKLTGFRCLLTKNLFVCSVFLCLTANVLRKTLLSAFLNRLAHAAVAAVVSPSVRDPDPCINTLASSCRISARGRFCGDQFDARAGGCRFGFQLLLFFALLLGAASSAQAAEKFCSDFPNGVIDGFVDPVPTQITIDQDCTFLNFTASNPLTATLNFQTNDPSIYLIIFDNVVFSGNMACANIDHRIWFSNSSSNNIRPNCQDLFIPVEQIDKQNPAGQTTATIGVPFTYTLTLPSLLGFNDPSLDTLHSAVIWDDLTATGADLTYVGINAYYVSSGAPVTLVPETDPAAVGGVWTTKNLSYEPIAQIDKGEQIVVEITVVLDDTPANVAGTTFINTAKWWFGRLIEIDGVPTFFDPLPGEWGLRRR